MIFLRLLICLFVSILTALQADKEGQDFQVSYYIETSKVTLDEPFKIRFEASYPKHYQLDIDALSYNLARQDSPLPGPFLVLETQAAATEEQPSGMKKERLEYLLQALQTGNIELPLKMTFIDEANAKKQYVYAPLLKIMVSATEDPIHPDDWPEPILQPSSSLAPVEMDPNLLLSLSRKMAEPAHKYSLSEVLCEHSPPWKQLLVGFSAIVIALFVIWPSPQHVWQQNLSFWPAASALKTARKALRKLYKQDKARPMTARVFYTALEDIIRHYLQATSPVISSSYTHEEINTLLPRQEELRSLLNICANGKFGSPIDSNVQRRAALKMAKVFFKLFSTNL